MTEAGCIVLISGPVRAGKTTLANGLTSKHGFRRLGTRDVIASRLPGTPLTREALQLAGERLDRLTDGAWVAEEVSRLMQTLRNPRRLVVDAVRIQQQIAAIRESCAQPVFHVHVTAMPEVLRRRYESNKSSLEEVADYQRIRSNATEAQVGRLAETADLVIDSTGTPIGEAVNLVITLLGNPAST